MSNQVKEPLTPDVYDKYASPKVDDLEAEQPEVKSASVSWLLLISMPRMAIQMAWAAQWAALGPYLGTMLPRFAVQITQIIGPLSGILVAPTVGVLSDRSTHPWGRRRPFLAYAAVFSAICWILMGYTREMGEALGDYGNGKPGVPTSRKWTATFTIFFYIWMDVTVNVVQTPAQLLVADLAGDRQTTGAALMQAWGALGSFLISGYIQVFGAAYLSLHTFMAMLACVMLGSVGVVCFFVKETPLDKNQVEQTSAWRGVANAFYSIYEGVRTLPGVLVVYCFIIFCVKYGYTAYNGNKGQFFGLEVYGGESSGADKCGNNCTAEQTAYSHGVRVAGGSTDLMFNAVGYIYSWTLPLLVRQFGVKWTLTVSMLPQCCLIIMAFTKVVAVNVFIVVITSTTQNVILTLIVPILIHVMGHQAEIGMYVGALNSANCFGQLLNFAIGAAIVQTPMGYKLPVLLGGIMTVVGVVVSIFFFKIKMNSL